MGIESSVAVLAVVAGACAPVRDTPTPRPPDASVRRRAPAPIRTPRGPEPGADDAVLIRARGTLEPSGRDEDVTLSRDGTLAVGARTAHVELESEDPYQVSREGSLEVVEVDRVRGLRGLLFHLPARGDEDPPDRFELFTADGPRLRRILSVEFRASAGNLLRLPGDGTALHVEDDEQACARARRTSGRVSRRQVWFRTDQDGLMRETRRTATRLSASCAVLSG